jgi:hypothetical protein
MNEKSWSFTVEGQPPSLNHMYKIIYVPRRNGAGLVASLGKEANVEVYQSGVTYIAKAARPSGWAPGRRVRILYSYYLNRDADCDNLKKAMNDAIALAIGCNDKAFLATDVLKETDRRRPRVEVEVINEE